MFVSGVNHLFVAVGLLLFVPSFCVGEQPAEKSAWQLRRDVGERERQLIRAQRELAEARARVALADGKDDLAIPELRKVVSGYQDEVQWIRYHANWFCDPRDLMTQALWDMCKARVWLAEVEGDTATLVVAWKQIVGFHEQQVERVKRLEEMMAVKPEETQTFQKSLDKARECLATAEKELPAQQASQHEESK